MVKLRLSALVLLALAGGAWPQSREQEVQKLLDEYVGKNGVAGASAAILERDGTLFATGSGFQDREKRIPASGDTVYRLGSISKPVTAIAALQLVEAGRLSLFADVRKTVPEWPDKGSSITLRHLLTHTSGIRHYVDGKPDRYYERFTPLRSLDVFKNDPLLFQPGERVSYSTHAFSLVARMVEAAGGEDFAAYIHSHVSVPAGAPTLSLEDRSKPLAARSRLYDSLLRRPILAKREEDLSWKCGGGGMEASAPDLARFAMAALEGKLLSAQTTDFMFQNQRVGALDTARGLGWALSADGNPIHGGAQQGCRTFLGTDRRAGRVWVVMTNTGGDHPIAELAAAVRTAWTRVPARDPAGDPTHPAKSALP